MTQPTIIPEDSAPDVLVIDDSPDVHRLLKARLRHEEVQFQSAMDGDSGLRQAIATKPALILLDLDMPGTDGFQVLRSLKADNSTLHIPVIVLSGNNNAQDKVTAFDLGAVDYITKPFNLTELRVRVRAALRMHRLLQMLAQRAQIDGLTSLWNRAYFNTRWAEEYAGCTRHRRPLSLAMIDADHFKSINDTYGHSAGDEVLQGIARLLQKSCRHGDIACRYGGEEFVVIMPETAPVDALNMCQRLLTRLAETTWARHPQRMVTASIGLAGATLPPVISAEQWVEAADRNLYAAKQAGRNRVVSSDVGPAPLQLVKAG